MDKTRYYDIFPADWNSKQPATSPLLAVSARNEVEAKHRGNRAIKDAGYRLIGRWDLAHTTVRVAS